MDSRYYFPMTIHNTIAAVPMSTEPMLSDSFRGAVDFNCIVTGKITTDETCDILVENNMWSE